MSLANPAGAQHVLGKRHTGSFRLGEMTGWTWGCESLFRKPDTAGCTVHIPIHVFRKQVTPFGTVLNVSRQESGLMGCSRDPSPNISYLHCAAMSRITLKLQLSRGELQEEHLRRGWAKQDASPGEADTLRICRIF